MLDLIFILQKSSAEHTGTLSTLSHRLFNMDLSCFSGPTLIQSSVDNKSEPKLKNLETPNCLDFLARKSPHQQDLAGT